MASVIVVMNDRITARLVCLHQKLLGIRTYNNENGNALFKYSIEFESLLNILIKTDNQKFLFILEDYNQHAQKFCQLCCEFHEEKNRYQAFSAGFGKLQFYLGECLKILL